MEKKSNTHGGARSGAGRPKGSTNSVTVQGLLGAIDATAGRPYIELLAEDFVHARQNDRQLAQKYHHLIMSKVAATLAAVEVTDSEDTVESRRRAFADALVAITGISTKQEKE